MGNVDEENDAINDGNHKTRSIRNGARISEGECCCCSPLNYKHRLEYCPIHVGLATLAHASVTDAIGLCYYNLFELSYCFHRLLA